jgi:spore photoproduct lyase
LTGFSRLLAKELASCPNVWIELKTKTAAIQNLIRAAPLRNIIISWSLNPQKIIRKEERWAASLNERLEAAAVCQEKGYVLGFHFDPIFYFPGWEEAYQQTVWLRYIHQEFIPALDKKMRYPQSVRVEIYRKFLHWIKAFGEETLVYLCMENSSVWRKVFGFIPGFEHSTLKEMLDQRVLEFWKQDAGI